MISIHDNNVLSYTIDLINKTVRLDTTWAYKERCEHTLIEFRGVLANGLFGACHANILNCAKEEPLEAFISKNRAQLEEWKGTCWPCLWDDMDDLLRQLREQQMRYFQIYDILGLSGWVLAQEMEFILLDNPPQAPYDHFDIY